MDLLKRLLKALFEMDGGIWCRFVSSILEGMFTGDQSEGKYVCYTLTHPERLGHLAGNTEIYLAEKKSGLHPYPESQTIFFVPSYSEVEDHGLVDVRGKVANRFLLQLWSEKYPVFKKGIFLQQVMDQVQSALPWTTYHDRLHGHRDIHGCLDRTEPSVEVTQNLKLKGDRLLEKMGVPKDAKIVLYHQRSSGYVKRVYEKLNSLDETRYSYRNASPSTYDDAVRWLIEKGYYVVRVGQESDPWHLVGKGAVDFAAQRKDEWMDLYLFDRCEFYCGTTSGIYALADLFRKPIIFTNFAPLGHVYSWSPRHLTIFKKLRDVQSGDLVPASKLLSTELGWTIHWEKIPKDRYVYEDNTPGEILGAVQEMVGRLDGKWTEEASDAELQQKFWSAIKISEYHCHKNSRIGTEFLRANADWLLR